MPPPLPDSDFGELRGVKALVTGWAREEVATAMDAWLTLVPGAPEGIAVHVYARNEADTARLQASESLRLRLDALASDLLAPWCGKYSFAWMGFPFSAPLPARR